MIDQGEYYRTTAQRYDELHESDPGHGVALEWLAGIVRGRGVESVLDVGAGTGRVIRMLGGACPGVDVVGIEPSAELRQVAVANGVHPDKISAGDGRALPFADRSYDVVTAFAVLHHVRDPSAVIDEMLRVARRFVFISDSNCFGQGSRPKRMLKHGLRSLGLWRAAKWVQTRGRVAQYSEGDGVAYSYSVFSSVDVLRRACDDLHFLGTSASNGGDLERTASDVAVLAVKRRPR